ncbi:hypothetical protein [Streptomyces sp. NBC_01481]|uniref:hypothetical protein n=1 Tax=Streptomyces sp. NBC_01481 TaxID=2975869 RepID=UPI00224DF43C|nr:hypothetical protein [Streptomyces sp. NBC_01481]MCX4583185.1 hypothetical protein [Streptomyces sp. NBC_01481]
MAISAVAVVTALTAWSNSEGNAAAVHRDAQAERVVSGREVFDFKNLGELVSTSPVIVKAEVTGIQPGRTLGSAEEGGVDQARDVTLSVTTSYKRYPTVPTSIVMEEWGWDEQGNGYQVEHVTWSQVGDKGFYFLEQSDATGKWQLVNTQARMLDKGGWLELSADPTSQFATSFWLYDPLDLEMELRRLTDTKNPPQDLPAPQSEPDPVSGDAANSPAPDDGTEEPLPDDSTNDGSEPTPYPSPS